MSVFASTARGAAHVSRIQGLYRQILRLERDYARDVFQWSERAVLVRSEFEANRHLEHAYEIEAAIKKAEEYLVNNAHPDPYKCPTAPGGTKWDRNAPPPMHVTPLL
ncbi:hypothetical protein H696_04076 [Fonticula alba]|uniref:NADH dehydrogenase [ubiquinone] 1 beta subcomplex subunit 9 n=1 Tax=Fonticula alba TaxID=691883 RepID=A0A058Z6B6_FONAL|nr:hypothetical protein H696_04076 [Fonticula alba]KCV69666.1 hypothetical protein H696_04076 [Fonticula alba]|eukprot:XP_009496231.1 hypothetical protein H696_04076 [Fonticula alba]